MPATYAHVRFARQMIAFLPQDIRSAARKGSRLYLAGAHGPDPLFYYNPFRENSVKKLGQKYHRIPGRELFGRCLERMRRSPEPEGRAYLYGLLTHYCLDTGCHPLVNGLAEEGLCDHTELETEFDRYLLALDGVEKPHTRDLGTHLGLTDREAALAAAFYPPLEAAQLRTGVRNMRLAIKLLSGRSIVSRPVLEMAMPHFGDTVRHQLMTRGENLRVSQWNGKLLEHYRQSMDRFPGLVQQLERSIDRNTPLGDAFSPIMG